MKEKKEYIQLGGEPFESFERVEHITEIIILGENGGVRRLVLK